MGQSDSFGVLVGILIVGALIYAVIPARNQTPQTETPAAATTTPQTQASSTETTTVPMPSPTTNTQGEY